MSDLVQKDSWRDFRGRYFKSSMGAEVHNGTSILGRMTILSRGYVLDASQEKLETSRPHAESDRTIKMQVISNDVGQSLKGIKSLSQFLRVMYDACVVQRNLYRECKILHRDITNSSIMAAPTGPSFGKLCVRSYYGGVKYINQILANDKNVEPEPACSVVGLGNDTSLERVRAGTTKFIARSISHGKLLPSEIYSTDRLAMPTLEGKSLELYKSNNEAEYVKFTEMVQEGAYVAVTPRVKHEHQLFHDAESTFWVIAWTLAHSTPADQTEEKNWPPVLDRFIMAMEMHRSGPRYPDYRVDAVDTLADWKDVLHPSLASVAGMLYKMHAYVYPEWLYRPELDVEHVHEALMRLLLTEIVRIEDSGADVELVIGTRVPPHFDYGSD